MFDIKTAKRGDRVRVICRDDQVREGRFTASRNAYTQAHITFPTGLADFDGWYSQPAILPVAKA